MSLMYKNCGSRKHFPRRNLQSTSLPTMKTWQSIILYTHFDRKNYLQHSIISKLSIALNLSWNCFVCINLLILIYNLLNLSCEKYFLFRNKTRSLRDKSLADFFLFFNECQFSRVLNLLIFNHTNMEFFKLPYMYSKT